MDTVHILKIMLDGLGTNILIVLLSSIIPLTLGILFTFLAKRSRIAELLFSYGSLLFECISPVTFLYVLFYGPSMNYDLLLFHGSSGRFICAVIALAICFIGYMPARFTSEYSLIKNVFYNGLGMLSGLFKWSFVARMIAVAEMTFTIETDLLTKGIIQPLTWALMITSVIIGILEISKRLVKQFMK